MEINKMLTNCISLHIIYVVFKLEVKNYGTTQRTTHQTH